MKKMLLSLALMLLGATVTANAAHTLTINGEEVQKTVSRVTFDGNNVVLHFNDGSESQSHDMNSVALAFNNTTGIEEINVMEFTGVVNGILTLGGVEAGTLVEVYNINGMTVAAATATESTVTLDLNGIANGVYIVRAGNDCVKFVKR